MKIEKLISVRVYDGKKTLHSALKTFLKTIREQSDWQTRFFWKEQAILDKLTRGTCLMVLLGDEICGLVDNNVQPLKTTKHPVKLHPLDSVWLSDFIIHPKYRKIGLGRTLLQITINYSRYLSKKQLMMEVKQSQRELQIFLTWMEFKPTTHHSQANNIIYQCELQDFTKRYNYQQIEPTSGRHVLRPFYRIKSQ